MKMNINSNFSTIENEQLSLINGGLVGITIIGLIKAGCWILGGIFALGAISGAA